jgi:adenylylsulfate kinase-like enzyme
MGASTSKVSYNSYWHNFILNEINRLRVHTNILIVGDKGSGKSTLSTKISSALETAKAWVHVFDTDTIDVESSKTKIQETYEKGVDVTRLSVIATTMPIHGIIWVVDASTLNTIGDFDHIRGVCEFLQSFSRCKTFVFFSHTDVATNQNMSYVKGLYLKTASIPNSGEYTESGISYAPLVGDNEDAEFTILHSIKYIVDCAVIHNGAFAVIGITREDHDGE